MGKWYWYGSIGERGMLNGIDRGGGMVLVGKEERLWQRGSSSASET